LNKKQRIRYVVSKIEGCFSNRDISERLPDVSSAMIQQELSKMSEEGVIIRSGTTKGTHYSTVNITRNIDI